MDRILKNVELGFRRFLIRLLRAIIVRSRQPIPRNTDFNNSTFLFVRQDRIGDVLVSTPLFKALKDKYPQARVDVLLSSNNHFVLSNDPLVRKRWVYEKRLVPGLRMLRNIRAEHYDFVIDLMDNPSATSTVICLLSGARWSVGLEKENGYVYDIVVPLLSRKDTHIVDRIAQLLTPFGINPAEENLRIRFTIPESAKAFAQRAFSELKAKPGRTIGINISAGHEVRFWGIDNFRKLLSLLRRQDRSRSILLLSKPEGRKSAEEIASGYEKVFVSPATYSFDEFAALIARCGLLITPDTSAVHLAAAFGIPSVVLYVQSNKELRIWDPYASRSMALIADVDDLRVISPDEVARAAKNLLHTTPRALRKQSRAAIVS